MSIYDCNDNLDFDFNSTEPPVFRIVVRPRERHAGAFAEALFRGGHDEHLYSVTAWGGTEGDALEKLLAELRQRYTPKSNHVVIEIRGGNVVDVRAVQPDELLVSLLDWDEVEALEQEGRLYEEAPLPAKQLNCVKEEP